MEKYRNKMILETFAIFFTFATPIHPLPELDIGHPQGALALATAAVERSLSLYRDDHLEWNKGTLSLKAMHENGEQKTGKTDSGKLKKSLKYDFSFTNWGEATDRWLKGVKKRNANLFPDVSKQARIMAGIKVKPFDDGTESLSSESGSDSSGRDLDSDYEGLGKGTDDNHQNEADGNGWNGDHDGNLNTDSGNLRASGDDEDGGQGNDGDGSRQVEGDNDSEADNEQEDDEEGGDGSGNEAAEDDEDGGEGLGNEAAEDVDYEMLEPEVRSEHSELEPHNSDLTDVTASDTY